MQEVSGRVRTHDLWVCIQCAREPTYTTIEKLRQSRQIELVISLRALPFTRLRIN